MHQYVLRVSAVVLLAASSIICEALRVDEDAESVGHARSENASTDTLSPSEPPLVDAASAHLPKGDPNPAALAAADNHYHDASAEDQLAELKESELGLEEVEKALTVPPPSACNGFSPWFGAYKDQGGSCAKWGDSTFAWCYVDKDYTQRGKKFVVASRSLPGHYFAPCEGDEEIAEEKQSDAAAEVAALDKEKEIEKEEKAKAERDLDAARKDEDKLSGTMHEAEKEAADAERAALGDAARIAAAKAVMSEDDKNKVDIQGHHLVNIATKEEAEAQRAFDEMHSWQRELRKEELEAKGIVWKAMHNVNSSHKDEKDAEKKLNDVKAKKAEAVKEQHAAETAAKMDEELLSQAEEDKVHAQEKLERSVAWTDRAKSDAKLAKDEIQSQRNREKSVNDLEAKSVAAEAKLAHKAKDDAKKAQASVKEKDDDDKKAAAACEAASDAVAEERIARTKADKAAEEEAASTAVAKALRKFADEAESKCKRNGGKNCEKDQAEDDYGADDDSEDSAQGDDQDDSAQGEDQEQTDGQDDAEMDSSGDTSPKVRKKRKTKRKKSKN